MTKLLTYRGQGGADKDEVMFITNRPGATHITLTEKAGGAAPSSQINREPMDTHPKAKENPQMGSRQRQKQPGLPRDVGKAPKPSMIRTQLGTLRRAKQREDTKTLKRSNAVRVSKSMGAKSGHQWGTGNPGL